MRIDLHTHSVDSPDGGLTLAQYRAVLGSGKLTHIAITDHDQIDFARAAYEVLGEGIIVGQEVTAREGELIGLFLHERIEPGQTAAETAQAIHTQGGLVYVPHPFETVRKGLSVESLTHIADLVDIIEVHNGRALFQDRSVMAVAWAEQHGIVQAASSDAHGFLGWPCAYTEVAEAPTARNLTRLLEVGTFQRGNVGLGVLYPKYHRLRRRFSRSGA